MNMLDFIGKMSHNWAIDSSDWTVLLMSSMMITWALGDHVTIPMSGHMTIPVMCHVFQARCLEADKDIIDETSYEGETIVKNLIILWNVASM